MQVKSIASTILLTYIKLPHGFKTFVLSIFEWPLKTEFTVYDYPACKKLNKLRKKIDMNVLLVFSKELNKLNNAD